MARHSLPGRKPLPAHLRKQRITITLSQKCLDTLEAETTRAGSSHPNNKSTFIEEKIMGKDNAATVTKT